MFCLFPRKSPTLEVRISLLDGPDMITEVAGNEKGEAIMSVLVDKVDLRMPEFFGFKYLDKFKNWHWLNLKKGLHSQLKHSEVERRNVLRGSVPYRLYLSVQFYPRDPCKIEHEKTRYHIFLQVKRDLIEGRLQVEPNLFITLGSLILQSDCGDYTGSASQRENYVRQVLPIPRLSREIEQQLKQAHVSLQGRQPTEVEYVFLEKVRWLDTYGALPFPVKDDNSMYCMFEITPFGLLIDRPPKKPNIIYWPRVASFSHRQKTLTVKVRDQKHNISYTFESGTKDLATALYKACQEHFHFFKMTQERSSRHMGTTMMPVKSVPSRNTPALQGASWERMNENHSDATSASLPESAHTAPSQFVRNQDPNFIAHQQRLYGSDGESEPIFSLSDSGISPGVVSHHRRRLLPTPSGRPYTFTPAEASTNMSPGSQLQYQHQFQNMRPAPSEGVLNMPNFSSIGVVHSDTAIIQEANRKRQSRRRAILNPSPSKNVHGRQPPEELLKHIRYEHVDPSNFSETDLRSIPYTNVNTNADLLRVRYSPKMKQIGKVHAKAGPPPAEILPQSSGPVSSGNLKSINFAPTSGQYSTQPQQPFQYPIDVSRPSNLPNQQVNNNRPKTTSVNSKEASQDKLISARGAAKPGTTSAARYPLSTQNYFNQEELQNLSPGGLQMSSPQMLNTGSGPHFSMQANSSRPDNVPKTTPTTSTGPPMPPKHRPAPVSYQL